MDDAIHTLETAVGNGDEQARMVLRDLLEDRGESNRRRFPWRRIAPEHDTLDSQVPLDGTKFMTMEILVPVGSRCRCKIDFLLDVVRRDLGQWSRGPSALLALSDQDIASRYWMPMLDWREAWDRRPTWREARRDRLVAFMRHGLSYPLVQCAWFTNEGWHGPDGPIGIERLDHARATWCELIDFLP